MDLSDFLVKPLPALVHDPFEHISGQGLFSVEVLDRVLAEFPDYNSPYWIRYSGANEAGKMEMSDPRGWPAFTAEVFSVMTGQEMAREFGKAFGIPDLVGSAYGGGLHCSPLGARLAMHTDFTNHPENGLFRRLNVLIFLNKGWEPSWGGALYLGSEKQVTVPPVFNQLGAFATSSRSPHGHPDPWQHATQPRRSLAVYFYSPEPPPQFSGPASTVWTEGAANN